MRRAGLHTRVTAGFAAAALVLSVALALVSYQLTRSSLVRERERTAVRAAYFDAATVHAGLADGSRGIIDVLRALDTGGSRRAVLRRDGTWYTLTADTGITAAIPAGLQRLAAQGRPGVQRVRLDGRPAVVVAVPLPPSAVYYEIVSLQELDETLRLLALVLTTVAIMTTAGGAVLGWYVTRSALRPLTAVAGAAAEIAGGDLTTRLDPATEPDLAPLADSFNHMVDELSRRLERDRRFAADVSHELRSPLQTLAAATSVLTRHRDQLDPRASAAATLVADEVARFQSLVGDLLELARGDQPARRDPVEVSGVVHGVCRVHGLGDDLVAVEPGTGTWCVERRRLEQVLANLLDNAAEHGGGVVAVRLGTADGRHYLEVDDAGPGVPEQDREVIFHRFVRGRTAQARGSGDGAGLGLALVAQHAAAHGGFVRVVDRPGGGARFRVELAEEATCIEDAP